jgi:hypothetical protein
MKYFIYCDESGESSFSDKSIYEYFSICTLTIDDNKRTKIKNTIKRKTAELYNLGWPKGIEIKASVLHGMKMNNNIPQKTKDTITGDVFIEKILTSVKNACSPRIDYIVVRKDGLKDPSFRNAPYGIAYNFFAGQVLIPIFLEYKDCFLTVDKRNKEMHSQRHFDGYIETKARGDAFEKGININLEIKHDESQTNYGLQAVDFFSWGIYRKVVKKDFRFFKIFNDLVQTNKEWYCS